jgi:hypothetical protein
VYPPPPPGFHCPVKNADSSSAFTAVQTNGNVTVISVDLMEGAAGPSIQISLAVAMLCPLCGHTLSEVRSLLLPKNLAAYFYCLAQSIQNNVINKKKRCPKDKMDEM